MPSGAVLSRVAAIYAPRSLILSERLLLVVAREVVFDLTNNPKLSPDSFHCPETVPLCFFRIAIHR